MAETDAAWSALVTSFVRAPAHPVADYSWKYLRRRVRWHTDSAPQGTHSENGQGRKPLEPPASGDDYSRTRLNANHMDIKARCSSYLP